MDTLAGEMWLNQDSGEDKIFYTTGRLTSEMVIKVAQMVFQCSCLALVLPRWGWILRSSLALPLLLAPKA